MKKNLVLLPGLLCDQALWRYQIDAFQNDYNIIVADMTGVNNMPEMARSVLDQCPQTFALAGLSMGGYCALEIIQQASGRIEKLALLDTTARADTTEQTESRQDMIALCQSKSVDSESIDLVMEGLLPRFIHTARLADGGLVKSVHDMANRIGAEAFESQQRAIMSRTDKRAMLTNIDCPVLILCGRQDVLTPPEVHQEIHDHITDSSLSVIEDCGHLSTMEKPEQVNNALRDWLAL